MLQQKKILLKAALIILLGVFMGCSVSDPGIMSDSGQYNPSYEESEAQALAAAILVPLVKEYAAENKVTISGTQTIDLGNGFDAEIPDLVFASPAVEAEFNLAAHTLLEESLGESYRYFCKEVTPPSDQDNTRADTIKTSTYTSQALHSIFKLDFTVKRHWAWWNKYYLSLEVSGLQEKTKSLKLYVRDSKGTSATGTFSDTKSETVTIGTKYSDSGLGVAYFYAELRDDDYVAGGYLKRYFDGSSYYTSTISGSYYTSTLRKLRYKSGLSWYVNTSFPRYSYLTNNYNVDESKHLSVAEVWKPASGSIRNIVFLSAGQQGVDLLPEAYRNAVTGQYYGWDTNPTGDSWKEFTSKVAYIDADALAGRIIKNAGSLGLSSSNTYFAVVFDACFYHMMPADRKADAVNGWLDWIVSAVGTSNLGNLENIYLAGSSRGGSLVCRLAYQMTQSSYWGTLKNTPRIIVSGFDGVAKETQDELFLTGGKVDNPLTSDSTVWCWESGLTTRLQNYSNIRILQVAGGHLFIPLGLGIRSFYLPYGTSGRIKTQWVDYSHEYIGRDSYSTVVVTQYNWFVSNKY
ncbi:MAG: hypothetical protein JXJ04_23835 [Spirochaetales bacterium]|nr:hypothetical protein [Spirochaetales bacterium]